MITTAPPWSRTYRPTSAITNSAQAGKHFLPRPDPSLNPAAGECTLPLAELPPAARVARQVLRRTPREDWMRRKPRTIRRYNPQSLTPHRQKHHKPLTPIMLRLAQPTRRQLVFSSLADVQIEYLASSAVYAPSGDGIGTSSRCRTPCRSISSRSGLGRSRSH